MSTPGEQATVQARNLRYSDAIGWRLVFREEAEQGCGFDLAVRAAERFKGRSLFVDELLDAKVREFGPRSAEAKGASLLEFRHLHIAIYGSSKLVDYSRKIGSLLDQKRTATKSSSARFFTDLWAHEIGHNQ